MPTQLELKAKELVESARAGDQNAMAMIVEVGKESRKGSKKAKRAAKAIAAYIKLHPVKKGKMGGFGNEPPTIPVSLVIFLQQAQGADLLRGLQFALDYKGGFQAACVLLANRGVPLNNTRIAVLANEFGAEGEEFPSIFATGVVHPEHNGKGLQPKHRACLNVGRCFGYARAIQLVRRPNSRLSRLSSAMGWELGE